jgi:hypothetical protein
MCGPLQHLWTQLIKHLPSSSSSSALAQLLPGAALPLAALQTKLQPGGVLADAMAAEYRQSSTADAVRFYGQLRTAAIAPAVTAAQVLVEVHIKATEATSEQQHEGDGRQPPAQPPTAAAHAWSSS